MSGVPANRARACAGDAEPPAVLLLPQVLLAWSGGPSSGSMVWQVLEVRLYTVLYLAQLQGRGAGTEGLLFGGGESSLPQPGCPEGSGMCLQEPSRVPVQHSAHLLDRLEAQSLGEGHQHGRVPREVSLRPPASCPGSLVPWGTRKVPALAGAGSLRGDASGGAK